MPTATKAVTTGHAPVQVALYNALGRLVRRTTTAAPPIAWERC
ncbi:MAG TPA: hypothetical protein VGC22_13445 [Chitinophaga sp.]